MDAPIPPQTPDGVRDLLIVGGGINGAGIARDAAGQGLSVTLVERGDLAGATSSASSKLIHGGLRYLEYREFRLVREALREREVLLRIAPHLVWPLRFILPHAKGLRPAWLLPQPIPLPVPTRLVILEQITDNKNNTIYQTEKRRLLWILRARVIFICFLFLLRSACSRSAAGRQ